MTINEWIKQKLEEQGVASDKLDAVMQQTKNICRFKDFWGYAWDAVPMDQATTAVRVALQQAGLR